MATAERAKAAAEVAAADEAAADGAAAVTVNDTLHKNIMLSKNFKSGMAFSYNSGINELIIDIEKLDNEKQEKLKTELKGEHIGAIAMILKLDVTDDKIKKEGKTIFDLLNKSDEYEKFIELFDTLKTDYARIERFENVTAGKINTAKKDIDAAKEAMGAAAEGADKAKAKAEANDARRRYQAAIVELKEAMPELEEQQIAVPMVGVLSNYDLKRVFYIKVSDGTKLWAPITLQLVNLNEKKREKINLKKVLIKTIEKDVWYTQSIEQGIVFIEGLNPEQKQNTNWVQKLIKENNKGWKEGMQVAKMAVEAAIKVIDKAHGTSEELITFSDNGNFLLNVNSDNLESNNYKDDKVKEETFGNFENCIRLFSNLATIENDFSFKCCAGVHSTLIICLYDKNEAEVATAATEKQLAAGKTKAHARKANSPTPYICFMPAIQGQFETHRKNNPDLYKHLSDGHIIRYKLGPGGSVNKNIIEGLTEEYLQEIGMQIDPDNMTKYYTEGLEALDIKINCNDDKSFIAREHPVNINSTCNIVINEKAYDIKMLKENFNTMSDAIKQPTENSETKGYFLIPYEQLESFSETENMRFENVIWIGQDDDENYNKVLQKYADGVNDRFEYNTGDDFKGTLIINTVKNELPEGGFLPMEFVTKKINTLKTFDKDTLKFEQHPTKFSFESKQMKGYDIKERADPLDYKTNKLLKGSTLEQMYLEKDIEEGKLSLKQFLVEKQKKPDAKEATKAATSGKGGKKSRKSRKTKRSRPTKRKRPTKRRKHTKRR